MMSIVLGRGRGRNIRIQILDTYRIWRMEMCRHVRKDMEAGKKKLQKTSVIKSLQQ